MIDFRNKYYLVSHSVSAVFTRRKDVCTQHQESCLESCLAAGAIKMQRRFVLYGLGGSGKTQVSLNFAQDNRERYLHNTLHHLK
jgi:hypothetical protein